MHYSTLVIRSHGGIKPIQIKTNHVFFIRTIENHRVLIKEKIKVLFIRPHIDTLAKKVRGRINVTNQLNGTTSGADTDRRRTATMSLVMSAAECCSPVWLNSQLVEKLDARVNQAMRAISGTLRSTLLSWLFVLSNIAHPSNWREFATVKFLRKR